MCHNSRITVIILLTVYQSVAVTHICCYHRFVCRKAFEYRKRLAFTYARKYCKVHPADIFIYIYTPCKYNILKLHIFNKRVALLCILLILIARSHNPELQHRNLRFGICKCHNQCLNILNRSHTKHRADINISVIRSPACNICESACIYSVRSYDSFVFRASKLYLKFLCMCIQGCNYIRTLISRI